MDESEPQPNAKKNFFSWIFWLSFNLNIFGVMDIYKAQNLYEAYYDYVWSKSNTLNKKNAFTVVRDLPRKMDT